MIILSSAKMLAMALVTTTLAGGAIGTGILFAGYTLAASRNPDESENLFNTTLLAFALIETFIFLGFGVAVVIYLL